MDSGKMRLVYFIYNLILVVLLLPYLLIRGIIKRRPIFTYFRKLKPEQLQRLAGKPVVWIQAVSVGEVMVAKIVIQELRKVLPDYAILVTTTTPTGQAIAKKLLEEEAVVTHFFIDLPFVVKRFIAQVQPQLYLMMEAEIWPNVIRYCKKAHVKVALLNGMMSERSFHRYMRLRSLMQTVLSQIDLFAMQNTESANRIGQLGAPLELIQVTGNAKFDQAYPEFTPEIKQQFLQQYHWSETDPILVAASTHKGEETVVLEAFQSLLAETSNFKLILAPRHPNRGDEVANLLKEAGLSFVRRSTGENAVMSQVVLLDTFGELGMAFNVATLVFMGGSLVPIGGHNVLEAAAQSKPVIYGPYMNKTMESKRLMEEADAGFTVNNAGELADTVKRLCADPVLCQKRGQAARQALLSNRGCAGRMAVLTATLVEGVSK